VSHPSQYTGSYEYEYKYNMNILLGSHAVMTDLNDSDTMYNAIYLNEKHTNVSNYSSLHQISNFP
jgi:hypothetical protein